MTFETLVTTSSLGERWSQLGVDTSLLTPSMDETQRGQFTKGMANASSERRALAEAPEHVVDLERSGELIGRGGMGVVLEATQKGLERMVAVKRPHPDSPPEAGSALLREARISGLLDHPNIIPVHALTRKGSDPVIVMKRIEGVEWNVLLNDPELGPEYGVGAEPLDRHLEILMDLCHAVHFAHSKKILHLDLKTSNVMIGRFGETYLLDWGIAVSFDDSPALPKWVPSVRDISSVVGTAAFMAPEQAEGRAEGIGPTTDTFQLGAILHQLLTGSPPYQSSTLALALLRAYECDAPQYGPEIPGELASIARKAMAKDPSERYQSAEELRRALAAYIEHRASMRLVSEARGRLKKVGPELTGKVDQSLSALDLADEVTLQRQLVECVFAFQQALTIWPDNRDATAGLDTVLRLVIERAIEARDLKAAASALADMPTPDPEIRARIGALKSELRADRQRDAVARATAMQVDPSVGASTRAAASGFAGIVWFVWNMTLAWGESQGLFRIDYPVLFANLVGSTIFGVAVTFIKRDGLLGTRINRQLMAALWGGFLTVWALWLASYGIGVAPRDALVLMTVIYVFFLYTIIHLDSRVWVVGVPTLPFAVLAVVDPERVFAWHAASGLATGVGLALVWRAKTHDAGAD